MLDLGVIEPFIQLKKKIKLMLSFFVCFYFFFGACGLREEEISTDPDKVKTVQDWPRPKTPKQMRGAFLVFGPITGNM